MASVSLDDYTITVLECRLDWLTLTQTHPSPTHLLLRQGEELLSLVDPDETQRKPWYWRQYTGEHCEWLTIGSREDSDILQISGPAADDWFEKTYTKATRCTRIDLAVTVKIEGEEREWAVDHYSEASEWGRKRGNAPGYSLVVDSAGGSTCYVGSRSSDLFGRLYNKAVESGDQRYAGCWRYEVELKGDVAERTATALCGCSDRAGRVREFVYNYFANRGGRPVYAGSDPAMQVKSIRPRSDYASRLWWLANQVRPAIRQLVAGGYEREVIEALGLDPWSVNHAKYRSIEHHSHNDQLQGE